MNCEFPYQSLFNQWPLLQVYTYHLNIGQGGLNIALIMYALIKQLLAGNC